MITVSVILSIISVLIVAAGLASLVLCGIAVYYICTSDDNCTACPGQVSNSCNRCGVQRRKQREERREARLRRKQRNE